MASADHTIDILIFALGARRGGLLAAQVIEVLRAATVLPLPGAPAVVEGVLDVRGEVVPVIDPRPRLGLPSSPLRPSDRLVLAQAGRRRVAVRVEQVLELRQVPADAVTEATRLTTTVPHVVGVARLPPAATPAMEGGAAQGIDEGSLVLLHDLEAFLSRAEDEALEAALRATEPKSEAKNPTRPAESNGLDGEREQ